MLLQNGSGNEVGHFSLHRLLHGIRLSLIWNGTHDAARFEDLLHGHRHRVRGHIIQTRIPTLTHLLHATNLIEFHHEVRGFCFKICRRIVKGDVPILTDPDEGDIGRGFRQQHPHSLTLHRRIIFAFNGVKRSQSRRQLGNKAIAQELAEGGRMGSRKPDVLVEVKQGHHLPGHLRLAQFLHHLELRRGRGHHDSCLPLACDHLPNLLCPLPGSFRPHFPLGSKYPNVHLQSSNQSPSTRQAPTF